MKQFRLTFVILVVILQATITFAGQLSSSLEMYKEKTQSLLTNENDAEVKKYLSSCLQAAEDLNGLEAGDPRVPGAFSKLVNAKKEVTSDVAQSQRARSENQAYIDHLYPYIKSIYVNVVSLQEQLLERKYFKAETAKNANFVEGYINGTWALTRADHSDPQRILNERHLGVSPWEAVIRLEPTLAFEHGAQAAILGTAGLSYTFFPDVETKSMPYVFKEDFGSKWVQKSGIRIGVGVGNLDNHAKALLGLGTQVNALGLWGLYKPDGGTFMFGLSASDLSKFKKFISWMY